MKIKSAISTIMFAIFTTLSILGFCVLGCAVDIRSNGIPMFLLIFCAWLACLFLAILFYDHRIIMRHVYAICCTVMLVWGVAFEKRGEKYQYLYKIMIAARRISIFYRFILMTYDACHVRKDS